MNLPGISTAARLCVVVALGAVALPDSALAAVQTWVSGVGDDANECTRIAPCKTFAGAISKTEAGGVISVLDPGGFGALTITKSITIDANGEFGGVLVMGTNGIVVAAGPTDHVVLRGLTFTGLSQGCPAGANTGLTGIKYISGGSLVVEGDTIQGFGQDAISAPLTASGSLTVTNSDLRDNCESAIGISTTAGQVSANVSDNFISNDGVAISAGASSRVSLSGNTIVDNITALQSSGGGTLTSFDDNRIAGNGSIGTTPIELTSPFVLPTPAPTSTSTPSTTTAPTPTCLVPNLSSSTLQKARKTLTKARCVLGTVTYRKAKHKHPGVIYAQQPKGGTLQFQGAIVNVTVNGHASPPKKKGPRAHKALLSGGATRTWVSGVGSDLNPCSRTAPCLTFAGALSKTAAGGTVDALDPGSFGPITLNTAASNTGTVTIQGNPKGTTIEVPTGSTGITVDSGAAANVILRNITIISQPGCTASGSGSGITVLSGGNLHLEDVQISGFPDSAIKVEPGNNMSITTHDSTIYDNCTNGISAQQPAGSVDLTLDGVQLLNNPTGVLAGQGATIRLANTTISGATTALSTTGTGVIQGWPDNDLLNNTSIGATPTLVSFS